MNKNLDVAINLNLNQLKSYIRTIDKYEFFEILL